MVWHGIKSDKSINGRAISSVRYVNDGYRGVGV